MREPDEAEQDEAEQEGECAQQPNIQENGAAEHGDPGPSSRRRAAGSLAKGRGASAHNNSGPDTGNHGELDGPDDPQGRDKHRAVGFSSCFACCE